MLSSLVGQIVQVEGETPECLDVTLYTLGEVGQKTYVVEYSSLTPAQKQCVDDYRAMLISLAPND